MADQVLALGSPTLARNRTCMMVARLEGAHMNTRPLLNTRYVWIEILLLATAVALALAILLAVLGATAGVAGAQTEQVNSAADSQSFEGMVTCSRCGAKHQPALDRSATNCVRVCVHGGASFALIDGDAIYRLEGDPISMKRVAGQRARVTGTRTGNTIRVASVTIPS